MLEKIYTELTEFKEKVQEQLSMIRLDSKSFVTMEKVDDMFYRRGELNGMMKVIENNSSVVRSLLETHMIEDDRKFMTIEKSLESIQKESKGNLQKWFVALIMFVLGFFGELVLRVWK